MRALALYGTIGSLVLTALATAPAGSADGPPLKPPAPVPHPIDFGTCSPVEHLPDSVECGKVTVPLDYAHPDGKKISLTVSRIRATAPKERQGALVFNPGGPGASSMDFPLYGALARWRKVARVYDFVGYAPRGVGRSAPLSCQDPEKFAKAPTDSQRHPTEEFKRKKVAQAKAYARGCVRNAGADLPFYNSVNNARDLDMIRAALGEKKLTFMGASYGTYFGAVYAALFPGHIRRMVLDSVVNPEPSQIWYANNLNQNIAFQRRWRDWLKWVAKHHARYDLGKTPKAVQRSYDKAVRQVRRAPVNGKIGPAQLQAAYLKTGYNDAYWAMRAQALSDYLHGNPKQLIAQAEPKAGAAKEEENSNAVYTAVECNDAPWPRDWRVWDRDNTRVAKVAPFETWDNAWMNLPCAFWPERSEQAVAGLEDAISRATDRATGKNADSANGDDVVDGLAAATSRTVEAGLDDVLNGGSRPLDIRTAPGALPPVLLLAAERDAATPYPGALNLQRRLHGASLVTEKGAGTHGIALNDNECVNKYTLAYLLRGEAPGHRVYCPARAEPKPDDRAKPMK
ncbi:alpha/beta hydrolase [Streptomyces halobius]|uniref:Alpha/beta hydrolase n=1 Tax=Streptomyces halobius TaxID=2879846 RepID=A0ABY4M496_9ACTN|nr:alpha/beta hydrolase [Streptomyces halobius]UQA92550.1 alpha/beta hydrolase [Streptomyces halobius]